MNWENHKNHIRYFLRDPDGRIWDDSFLLRLWNDVQNEINHTLKLNVVVDAVGVPSQFSISYFHPFEWAYSGQDGTSYKALLPVEQAEMIVTQPWEMEELAGFGSSTSGSSAYTQPWEAFLGEQTNLTPPIMMPQLFESAIIVAWDEEPIQYESLKSIQDNDPSFESRTGEPQSYYRKSIGDNTFYLYPKPSSIVWPEDAGGGIVLFEENETVDSDLGGYIVAEGGEDEDNLGVGINSIASTNNILFVYHKNTNDLICDDDVSDLPSFLCKYVIYGVLERSFMANTDGRTPSLAAYWGKRKMVGMKLIQKFMTKRTVDRDIRLRTPGVPGARNRRQPRLPDSYPAVWA
jgi:hypothetical protein